jgi:hypothetical protein
VLYLPSAPLGNWSFREESNMRTRISFIFSSLVCCLLALAVAVTAARGGQREAVGAASTPIGDHWDAKILGQIHIEKVPEVTVIQRTVTGGLDKTNEAFVDLKQAMLREVKASRVKIEASAVASAVCYGLYPQDPDRVKAEATKGGAPLQWTAALPVPAGFKAPAEPAKALSVPASNYEVKTLPATLAAVMFSTVGRASVDGLKFFGWMAENGYVQVAPTRMVYYAKPGNAVGQAEMLNAAPALINSEETKIIVPIAVRPRGIALKPEAATVKPPIR